MIYNVLSVSSLQQSESATYICISILFRLFSHIGHYKVLSRVPCAIQWVLISYLIICIAIYYIYIYTHIYIVIYLYIYISYVYSEPEDHSL